MTRSRLSGSLSPRRGRSGRRVGGRSDFSPTIRRLRHVGLKPDLHKAKGLGIPKGAPWTGTCAQEMSLQECHFQKNSPPAFPPRDKGRSDFSPTIRRLRHVGLKPDLHKAKGLGIPKGAPWTGTCAQEMSLQECHFQKNLTPGHSLPATEVGRTSVRQFGVSGMSG